MVAIKQERTQRTALRLTDDEAKMLRRLADDDGLTVSDIVRLLIRREHAAKYGDTKKGGAKPKK